MLQLSHKSPQVYQQAVSPVAEVYEKTKTYPKEEQFILVSQLPGAVISVWSNLAEGAARRSPIEKKRFCEILQSSPAEVHTRIEVSPILNELNKNKITASKNYLESVFKMLRKMIGNTGAGG